MFTQWLNYLKVTGHKWIYQFLHFKIWYANINLLHQHEPRIGYLKSIQTFDVHFESVHTQPVLFQYRIKVGLNRNIHMEIFLYWQSRTVWFQPSSNGNWLKRLLQFQQIPAARLLVQMCRLTVAFVQDFWTVGRPGTWYPAKQSDKAVAKGVAKICDLPPKPVEPAEVE